MSVVSFSGQPPVQPFVWPVFSSLPVDAMDAITSFLPRMQDCSYGCYQSRMKTVKLHVTNKEITDKELINHLEKSKGRYSYIDISGCKQLTGKSLICIAKLGSFISVNISDCKFSEKDIAVLATTNLRSLNLSSCQRVSGKCFDKFKTVVRLNLTECRGITSAAYTNLRQVSNLHDVTLAYTLVTDEDIQNLRGLKKGSTTDKPESGGRTNLRYIDLTGCENITAKTVTFLMKDLRDNQIRIRLDSRISMPKLKLTQMDPIHSIKNPLRKGGDGSVDDATLIKQINKWKEAVMKRTGQLWQHKDGLRGHIAQIQGELRRVTPELLKNVRDDHIVSGEVYSAAVAAQEELRDAVLRAKAGGKFKTSEEDIPPLTFPLLTGKDLINL